MVMTRQIQKTRTQTRTTAAVTKTQISQKQSLETVQTLIHGSLSCLMFLRDLVYDSAFDSCYYESGPIISYEDYASGKLPVDKNDLMEGTYTPLRILRRGRSKRVDKLLDWLEKVAFPLLADGKLEAIRVHVQPDQHDDEKILEAYMFTVKYCTDTSGIKSPVGIEMGGGSQGASRTVGQVNADLRYALSEITQQCANLPALPDDRFVSIRMVHSDSDINIEGFGPCTSNKIHFAHADGWRKETKKEELDSQFHGADIKIAHLWPENLDPQTKLSPDFLTDFALPEIAMWEEEHMLDDTSATVVEEATTVVEDSLTQVSSPVAPKRTSSVTMRGDVMTSDHPVPARQVPTPLPTSQIPPPAPVRSRRSDALPVNTQRSLGSDRIVYESLDTQSSNVPRMKTRLQRMMESDPLTQGDTQTQAVRNSVPPTPSQAVPPISTPTTASGLDLHASVMPYRTPLYPGPDRGKRRSDEDDSVYNSPTRGDVSFNSNMLKRFKCIKSLDAFNANGQPSSPAIGP